MFKLIKHTHPILKSEKFKKDEISFNILLAIIQDYKKYPDMKCYSDEKDCFLLNTDEKHPVIIWTSSDFNRYEDLYRFLIKTFFYLSPLNLMTNKKCYQFFKSKDSINTSAHIDTAGVYECKKLNPIEFKGQIDVPTPSEKEIIFQMIKDFYYEADQDKGYSDSYYMELSNTFINQPETHKVWRDETGEIASIGRLQIVDDKARIGRVYTLPEKRGKSYAKMLVYKLTQLAFEKELLPVLYTNFDYEPSNKCYQAIGFKLLENILIYSIKKES